MNKGVPIIPVSLIKPSSIKEYNEEGKQWLRAYATMNNEMITVEGRLPTCCPSFVIHAEVEPKGKNVYKIGKVHKVERIRPNEITQKDVNYMTTHEITIVDPAVRADLYAGLPMSVDAFQKKKAFNVVSNCDFFRIESENLIRSIYTSKYSSKWEKRFAKMDTNTMGNMINILSYKPWLLCFDNNCFKSLPVKRLFLYACPQEVEVRAALRLYEYLLELRELGDTMFPDLIGSYTKNRAREYYEHGFNKTIMEKAMGILYQHGGLTTYENVDVLIRDFKNAKNICARLNGIEDSRQHLNERAFEIPCKPIGDLTIVQQAFVRHVVTNPLTLLHGPPGTGKTECLVALMARFTAPLVVTFVGQMVDALQKRFGCRVETAHTIHSIIFSAADSEWLSQFDLIIIDEFSNVDERLFSRLLSAVPRACRLVCAGDLAQIFPIKPGCPFYDLSDQYPQHSHELTENKRVDPDAAALAQASILLREGLPIPFSENGALRFVERVGLEPIEDIILGFGKDVMDFQVVTLRNVDRKLLNTHIQEILIKHKILKPPKKGIVDVYGSKEKLQLYKGQKIQFLKNTPAFEKYSAVRNGELVQVESVKRIGVTFEVKCTNGKMVLIGSKHVAPKHVIPGYATTCNKAQGSEWKYILFYIYESPNRFFTREYPYVAVSRAKKQCVIVGKKSEFEFLCAKKARPRFSILRLLLQEEKYTTFRRIHDSSQVPMQDYTRFTLLPPNVPAVPIKK